MSRSRQRWAQAGVWLLLAAAALLGAQRVRSFVERDPLLGFRPDTNNPGDQITVEMSDVSYRQYRGAKLVGKATIGKIEVARDRQILHFTGLRDGMYLSESGKSFKFWAQRGTYTQVGRTLEVDGQVRVVNTDLDLTTDRLRYSMRDGLVAIPASLKGRFFSGQIEAVDLKYRLDDGAFSIGPVSWAGTVQASEVAPARNRWTIKASGGSRPPGDIEVWMNAEATDGEVIVKANRLERNVKSDVLVATGNVRYFSADADLLCTKATVFRREKRAVMEGQVSMYVKPEQSRKLEPIDLPPLRPVVPESIAAGRPAPPANDDEKKLDDEVRSASNRRKYPMTIVCTKVEYWYARGARRAVATGAPQARQDFPGGRWRQTWAQRAVYDREKETLRLESGSGRKDVRVKTSIGDDLRAVWFTLSTRDGDDSWSGEGIEGEVVSEDEDLNPNGEALPPSDTPTAPPLQGPIGGRFR